MKRIKSSIQIVDMSSWEKLVVAVDAASGVGGMGVQLFCFVGGGGVEPCRL